MWDAPIRVALLIGAASILIELISAFTKIRIAKIAGYCGVLVLSSFAASLLFMSDPGTITLIIWIICAYRMLNAARVLSEHMHKKKLHLVTQRTSLYLLIYLLLSVAIWQFDRLFSIETGRWLYALATSALIVALTLNIILSRNLKKTVIRPTDKFKAGSDLPTVSVCIPARNETDDLPAVLDSVLASNYPKLEILVLDDCSQDRTSEVIKSFAQHGVRFIKGDAPRKGWLAKNQAYQTLAEAATGELILFCGVDIRFGKQAIWAMVDCLMSRNKKMLSILPIGLQTSEAASIVQPMRYWWELAWPRKLFNRPPVLSSCWLIDRNSLMNLGNFKAVDNTVIPEGYFARELLKKDQYSFLRTSGKLEISSAKQLDEQWETAVRTRYPELRKKPEVVLLLAMLEVWILLLPVGIFIAGFFTQFGLLWLTSGVTTVLLGVIHYRVIRASQFSLVSVPLALLPVAVLTEIYLLHYSMMKYEFSAVIWKERNICIPVMRSIPHLPKA